MSDVSTRLLKSRVYYISRDYRLQKDRYSTRDVYLGTRGYPDPILNMHRSPSITVCCVSNDASTSRRSSYQSVFLAAK